MRHKYFLTRQVLCVVLTCCASVLHAHPHNWIALNTTFVLNDKAQLVELTQSWEFDIYYSMMTMADVLNEYPDEATGLPATASEMIRNLRGYDYFSSLRLNDRSIALPTPTKYLLKNKLKEGGMVLELEMTFVFDEGISVEGETLAWQVYDPTYYIAMNHATKKNIQIVGGNATECSKSLEFPEPSDELIDYAQSLDRTRKDTDGLGASFAETAYIRCV